MKKIFFLFACIWSFTALHAKPKVFNDHPRVLSVSELSMEKILELAQSKHWDCILHLKEGNMVPLQFLMKTSLLSARIDPNLSLKVEKTCYFRVANKKGYFSEDLVHWEKGSDYFFSGTPSHQLKPTANNSGLVLESSLVPYEKGEPGP